MVYAIVALILAVLCIYLGALVCTIAILCDQVKKQESGRYRG